MASALFPILSALSATITSLPPLSPLTSPVSNMLELSLSHEEWRFLQFAMILSSSYQIWGSAHRLYDRYKRRQRAQKLESAHKELERLSEQLKRRARQGHAPFNFDEEVGHIREEQRRRVERGEAPWDIDEEIRLLRENWVRVQELRGQHVPGGGDEGAAQGNEGHGIEGETIRG